MERRGWRLEKCPGRKLEAVARMARMDNTQRRIDAARNAHRIALHCTAPTAQRTSPLVGTTPKALAGCRDAPGRCSRLPHEPSPPTLQPTAVPKRRQVAARPLARRLVASGRPAMAFLLPVGCLPLHCTGCPLRGRQPGSHCLVGERRSGLVKPDICLLPGRARLLSAW